MIKTFIAVFLLANLALMNCVPVSEPELEGGPVCSICTVVLSAAQNLIEQNKTEVEIVDYIEKHLCGRLGALNATCVQYVDAYGKQIIYELGKKIDPSVICHSIGLCAVENPKPTVIEKPMFNSLNCSLCKLVFGQVKTMLASNATEAQVDAFIEQKLCNATGRMSTACKNIIDTYGPAIMKYLSNDIDPAKLCTLIGFCSSSEAKIKVEKIKLPMISKNVNAGPFCVACEYLVQYVDTELKNNATDAKIVEGMEKLCGVIPPSQRKECVSIVSTYGVYLIQLFTQFADPLKVCQAVSLC